ncbi:hypothetical protein G5V57_24220 [Nordella sp. HKS 07]|uniref:hypothetical protein n=1 Tax=Nordella sp. HKS 07 TaxID=2712222 RepID=UPI0013E1AF24|nr:hypothetical protein [Nordella sp. HKS 07]QIG50560.1 hypothetical protein G5V57_24220 [Nordella sp. HKS 07]
MTTFSILSGRFVRTSNGWLVEGDDLQARVNGPILKRNVSGHALMVDDKPFALYKTLGEAQQALRRATA